MMGKTYEVERKKISYVARFYGDIKREFKAVNEYQARKIAEGLARSNQWTIESFGRA